MEKDTHGKKKLKELENAAMPDPGQMKDRDIAKKTLDAMIATIDDCLKGTPGRKGQGHPKGVFYPDDVIRIVKLWEKATSVRLTWSDTLKNLTVSRSCDLVGVAQRAGKLSDAVETFWHDMDNSSKFHQVEYALYDFLYEYRKTLTDVNKKTEFETKFTRMVKAGLQGLADDALVDEDLVLLRGE